MPFCPKCGEHYWNTGRHVCPPLWLVWNPDDGETAQDVAPIGAYDAERAAETRVERCDPDDGFPVAVDEVIVTVHVAPVDEPENVRRFTVRGSMDPSYFAEEVEDDKI